MLVAIHRAAADRDCYIEGWTEYLSVRGVDVRWVDLTAQDTPHQVQDCDGVMWHRTRTPKDEMIYRILQVIEYHLGIAVFPNYSALWHRRDKLAQYYLFRAAGVPMPKTWVFWDQRGAREWALETDYPKVFKLSTSGNSQGVVLVSSAEEACRLIDRMFGSGISSGRIEQPSTRSIPRNLRQLRTLASHCKASARYFIQGRSPMSSLEKGHVYFQEYVPGNDYKTGIIVIGDRAFGYQRFNKPNDFRSYSKKYDWDPSHVDLKCVQMAFDISERLGFNMMAYDFLLHHSKPVVLEMHFKDGKACGYWKRNLEWVSGWISHQEAQVETFLHSIRSGNGKPVKAPDPLHARTVRPEMGLALPWPRQ